MALKCLGPARGSAHLAVHRGRGGVELSGLLCSFGVHRNAAHGDLAYLEPAPRPSRACRR